MKYLISCLFIFSIHACSHGQQKHVPESTVLKNYEKKYNSLRVVLKNSLAKGINNLNDYNHIFLTTEKEHLDSIINGFKRETGIRIVIFTFDSLMTSEDSVEEVTKIIGIKNQVNTTIGLSFPNKSMSIWNDSLINNTIFSGYDAKYMIDKKFIPFFKNGEFFKGTEEGLKAIIQAMINNRKYRKPS